MRVRPVLAVLLLFLAPAAATSDRVTFEGERFAMTCPEEGKWYKNDKELTADAKTSEHVYNSDTKGLYRCEYGDGDSKKPYYFYVKGKACATCIELDGYTFGLVLAADMAGTIILMAIIYKCAKKRSSAGPGPSSRAPARSGGRGPPVPSPDYETLNAHTRSQDPYSVVNRLG